MNASSIAAALLLTISTRCAAHAAKTIKPAEIKTLGQKSARGDVFPLQNGAVAIRTTGGLAVYGVDGKQLGRRLDVADNVKIDDGNVHLYENGRRLAYLGGDRNIYDYDLVKEEPVKIMHTDTGSAMERPIGAIDTHLLAYVKLAAKKTAGFLSRPARIGQKPELEPHIVIADRSAPDNVKAEVPLKRTQDGKARYQLRALSFIEDSNGLLLAKYAGAMQVWRVRRNSSTSQVSVDSKPVVDLQVPAIDAQVDYDPKLDYVTFLYRDAAGNIKAEQGHPRQTMSQGVYYVHDLRTWTLDAPAAATGEKLSVDARTGNARVYLRDPSNVEVAKFRLT